jgi:multidrug efflux pump subunit AcrB
MSASNTLIDVFTRHKVASNLTMIMMVLAGMWAVDRIHTQLDPAIDMPVVYVRANWPGASAEDVEKLITVPVEQQLRTVVGLQHLRSVSYNGGAWIRAKFGFDVDMIQANDEIKQRVAQIRNFPADMEPINVKRAKDYEYISAVLVTSDGTLSGLILIVRNFEKQLLARGIDSINFEGLPEEELAIQVSSAKLYELNTSLDDIAQEVRARSSNSPAGTVGRGQGSRLLRSLDQKRDVFGFSQLEVSVLPDGRLTQLGNIATIQKRPKDGQTA